MIKLNLITELQNRNLVKDCTNLSLLNEKLNKEQMTIYNGFDLTAKSLHIGHLIPLLLLKLFWKYQHRIIIILGSGTTKIGDPSDKNEMRKMISNETILENKMNILKNISNIFNKNLSLQKENEFVDNIMIIDNATWLDKLNYIDFLREIGSHFTINKMINMDFVKRRLDEQVPLTFLEFNYMLIQGYDFYYLNKEYGCNIQSGGSEQWGNIIQGCELIRRKKYNAENSDVQEEVFGLTIPLLTKSDGSKMGKTAGGAVFLNQELFSALDFYQYFRNVDDKDVIKLFKALTEKELTEIQQIESDINKGTLDINEAKHKLAFEITKLCHGENVALEVQEKIIKLFQNTNKDDISEEDFYQVAHNLKLVDLIVNLNFAESKSSAKKLIESNAVKIDNIVITDVHFLLNDTSLLDKKFLLIVGKKKRQFCKLVDFL